ncbi:radical SAM family heme chaperone HemW [candidate division KSB1 bacterium]|nr:radical SAM family heme chaperone HemW [candidate division KSB1 bacterium]
MPGIYLHLPFCLQKCNYCDFYSITATPLEIAGYHEALLREIQLQAVQPRWQKLLYTTIYLGGGTPSLLTPAQVEQLLKALRQTFQFAARPEITLEVNPETVDQAKLSAFHASGVNRVNIGIQSFQPRELSRLNRIHRAVQARKSLVAAGVAGFQNIGLDLIFAIPGQTLADWQENLTQALDYSPQHLATYSLTFEPGTPLTRALNAGQVRRCPESRERKLYLATIARLTGAGYEHYEISNFARPGYRSRHNQIYWREEPYLGLGAAAHSFSPPQRTWNVASVAAYQLALSTGRLPQAASEILSRDQQMLEWIMLGLRRKEGLDLKAFESKFQTPFQIQYRHVLEKLTSPDRARTPRSTLPWFEWTSDAFRLTSAGWLVYDQICREFV